MSIVDEVLCNHPLFGERSGEVHLTHSLGAAFPGVSYEITARERLEVLVCIYEDRSDPNAKGWAPLGGSLTPVFTGERQGLNYHGWLALPGYGRVKFTDGSLVGFESEARYSGGVANKAKLVMSENEVATSALGGTDIVTDGPRVSIVQETRTNLFEEPTSTSFDTSVSASTKPPRTLLMPITVRIEFQDQQCDPPRQSPFLTKLIRTTSVLDDAARKEWSDDVEFRLRKVVETLGMKGACYEVERFGNAVLICTVSPLELTKQQIASLSAGRWPRWAEILDSVPELTSSIVEFDAANRREWCRRWDIEDVGSLGKDEHAEVS